MTDKKGVLMIAWMRQAVIINSLSRVAWFGITYRLRALRRGLPKVFLERLWETWYAVTVNYLAALSQEKLPEIRLTDVALGDGHIITLILCFRFTNRDKPDPFHFYAVFCLHDEREDVLKVIIHQAQPAIYADLSEDESGAFALSERWFA